MCLGGRWVLRQQYECTARYTNIQDCKYNKNKRVLTYILLAFYPDKLHSCTQKSNNLNEILDENIKRKKSHLFSWASNVIQSHKTNQST